MYELLAKVYLKKTWGNILLFAALDAIGIVAIATIYNMVTLGQSNNSAADIFVVNNAISPTHYLPSWYENKVREQEGVDQVTSLTPLRVFVDGEVATFNITDRDIYIDLLNVNVTPSPSLPSSAIPENTVYISRDLEEFTIDEGAKLAIHFAGITGLNGDTIEFSVAGYIEDLNGSECKHCIISTKEVFENRKGYPNHVVSQLLFSAHINEQLSEVSKMVDAQFTNERYRTKTVPLSQLESRLKITFRSIGEGLISLAVVIALLLVTLKFIEVKFIDNIIRTIERPLLTLGCARSVLSVCRCSLIAAQLVLPILIVTVCMEVIFGYLFSSASVLAPLFRFDTGVLVITILMAMIIALFNFVGMFRYEKYLATN